MAQDTCAHEGCDRKTRKGHVRCTEHNIIVCSYRGCTNTFIGRSGSKARRRCDEHRNAFSQHWGVQCQVPSCNGRTTSRGYCAAHYNRLRRTGSISADVPIQAHVLRGLGTQPEYNPELRRQWHLIQQYGITLADYDAMVAAQDGMCGICLRPTERLAVDHDHDTGRIRGLLCVRCNAALGGLKDDIGNVRRALQWLEER